MATQNSSNQDYTSNADGFSLSGGNTKRKITVTSGDVTLSGSSTPKTYNFPDQNGTVALLETVYPVGSIYLSVNSANPSIFFGGTWVAWGAGRVPLAMGNNGTTDYTTVESGGGTERVTLSSGQMPSFSFGFSHHGDEGGSLVRSVWASGGTANSVGINGYKAPPGTTGGAWSSQNPSWAFGNNESHENRMPYITCYMWKRTA